MRIEYLKDDVEVLRPLAVQWLSEQHCQQYGVDVKLDVVMDKLHNIEYMKDTELIVAWDGQAPIGLFVVFAIPSLLGDQRFAFSLYWYILPEYAGNGIRLLREAKKWAANQGCTHFIPGVSKLAGACHDEVCELLVKDGYQQFETTWMIEV